MNLRGILYLGWRYLLQHRGKAILLISAITLSLFLPIGIFLLVHKAEAHLRSRAEATPLLLGGHGSPLELVFNGLYFSKPDVVNITSNLAAEATDQGMGRYIPIYARYQARKHRIVGTSIDYFRFRDLEIADGRLFGRLGDCVLGAEVAQKLQLGPGDTISSTPEQTFDIAGVYPLKMRITGVLAPSGSSDDRAIFCDLKTTWVIEGIAHGHNEATESEILDVEGNNTAINAKIVEFTEITADNVKSFHFHGDPGDLPISAAIIIPRDQKAETILLGRYQTDSAPGQLVRPDQVMVELFNTVFQIRNLVIASLIAVAVAASLIAALVFVLSHRLRAREFESLANLGTDQTTLRLLVGFEAGFVLISSLILVAALVGILNLVIVILLPQLTA
tara:strand:- start:4621 stop:5793 length:1173 start_codon:yes stop_codon:yes gene_type:complete